MKKYFIKSIVFYFMVGASVVYAEETVYQVIGPINYNGSTNTAFFRGSLKWGATSCPNATYVQITSNVSGRKEMLSLALAAKMANRKVQFWGSCNADTNYFDAMYIVVD